MQDDQIPLCPRIMLEHFEKWALDFLEPITPTSINKMYILVYTDFVTKWVEGEVVSFATENSIVDFLFEGIFTRFGVPRELMTDKGS